ncbi:MAG TPA: pentapeptide repeat-containing protein [Actinomycetes bacterium]|nr:pentapeptide repeat-containing protein [Actinomycetes bacterium]
MTLAGIAGTALLVIALWLCVAVLPQRLYPPLSNADLAGLSPADQAARREGRAKVQNDARTSLLQALAALLVLSGAGIGAAVTLRQVRIGREQLEQAREQAQRSDERLREQIAVAQEGQITDRFTRAVDQLGQPGADRLDVRLGGIYALERIAHDSPTHRLAVFEILTAFIRSHAPWPPRVPGQYRADAPLDQIPSLQTRAPDVQAALTIIGRRPAEEDDPRLDINQTDLRAANLHGANLTGAWLVEANLTGAQLGKAQASHDTIWPDGWNRTRRAAAGINEPDEEAPPAAPLPI